MRLEVTVKVKSPLHLGSGQADVNVDAEVIHDECGLPYFPGRRFKGLLFESALEVCEMSERSGVAIGNGTLDALFHHEEKGDVQLVIPNLYIKDPAGSEMVRRAWKALEIAYPDILRPADVLAEYTDLRYQTKMEDGVAVRGSLHNMRVVNAGIEFTGIINLVGECAEDYLPLLAAAIRNLHTAGLKRTRGFGMISCHLVVLDGIKKDLTETDILKEVFA